MLDRDTLTRMGLGQLIDRDESCEVLSFHPSGHPVSYKDRIAGAQPRYTSDG
jgi:hypothetical protein